MDPSLWIKQSTTCEGNNYIATYVDDVIIISDEPQKYMTYLEQHFVVQNIKHMPQFYLGCNLQSGNGRTKVSLGKYIGDILNHYQMKHGDLKKQNIPISKTAKPQHDDSPLFDDEGMKHFQHIIRVCQWLVTAGCFNICYAVSTLSRFSAAPREGHLKMAQGILGYIKKYPKKAYFINPKKPNFDLELDTMGIDFGKDYDYFKEDIDPHVLKPLHKELEVTIFLDSSHDEDTTTG